MHSESHRWAIPSVRNAALGTQVEVWQQGGLVGAAFTDDGTTDKERGAGTRCVFVRGQARALAKEDVIREDNGLVASVPVHKAAIVNNCCHTRSSVTSRHAHYNTTCHLRIWALLPTRLAAAHHRSEHVACDLCSCLMQRDCTFPCNTTCHDQAHAIQPTQGRNHE